MIVGATAVVLCAACGALKPPKAQFATLATAPIVFAMNGAAPGSPAGIDFLSASAVTLDANFQFNVALDLDSAGQVVIYPAKDVANGLTSTISVGLQPISGTFDAYTDARKNGYTFDSTLVVPVGQVVGVNVLDPSTCTVYSLGTSYYAKFVVDSVNLAERAMFTRVTSDPNCGYVSFTPGLPTK